MASDDMARLWHDQATRGEQLSAEEQAQLENWYALQDDAERQMLGLTTNEETLATLQTQIEATLTQIVTVTRRIQETASENEVLRREIAVLRRQVAGLSTLQPA